MAIFFASTNMKKDKKEQKEEAEDDFLDLIFASRRNVENVPPPLPPPDAPLEPPDEDLRDDRTAGLDALFAKPVNSPQKSKAPPEPRASKGSDNESFDDFFH